MPSSAGEWIPLHPPYESKKSWPASVVDPHLTSFTIGSSKDVVLKVQGTPTELSEDKFGYGRSEVYFRNNKVVSWKEDPASAPLWAH